MEHKLIGDTLQREGPGVAARCTCGWTSGGHFSSLAASAAMTDHQEQARRSPPRPDLVYGAGGEMVYGGQDRTETW